MVALKTKRGIFAFESLVDAHAFVDKLKIEPEWSVCGLEDTKYYGGYYASGDWQVAINAYNRISRV